MPYFHVDDQLHDARETRAAGLEAMGLHELAGSWSAGMLTDGFVPEAVAVRWAPRRLRVLAAALVTAGYWARSTIDEEPGWQFVGWAEQGQPTKAGMEAARAAKAEAGRIGGRASGAKRAASARRSKPEAAVEAGASDLLPEGGEAKRSYIPTQPTTDPDGSGATTAQTIIAAWIDGLPRRPPDAVVGQLAKNVGRLLDEGFDESLVSLAVAAWQTKGTHPSTLPSVLHEISTTLTRPSTTDQRVAAAAAIGDQLRRDGM